MTATVPSTCTGAGNPALCQPIKGAIIATKIDRIGTVPCKNRVAQWPDGTPALLKNGHKGGILLLQLPFLRRRGRCRQDTHPPLACICIMNTEGWDIRWKRPTPQHRHQATRLTDRRLVIVTKLGQHQGDLVAPCAEQRILPQFICAKSQCRFQVCRWQWGTGFSLIVEFRYFDYLDHLGTWSILSCGRHGSTALAPYP